MQITDCRINYLENPFIDRQPYVHWTPVDERRGCRQSAYRVRVQRLDDGVQVCDTGWVDSPDCSPIPLPMRCEPLTPYRYTVEAKDELGHSATPGEGRFWGAKCGQPFAGKWITGAFCDKRDNVLGAVYLRREFAVTVPARRALLVICGLGYFQANINGQKVGDDYLSTPLTAFDQQVQYRVFDVTALLAPGGNALAVTLGNGFYNCFTKDCWATEAAVWRDVPKLLCELHLIAQDGSQQCIRSDDSWLTSPGPITLNGLRHGEYYDARLSFPGWDMPGFDAGAWKSARYCRAPGGTLSVMEMEPIRAFRRLHPRRKWRSSGGWMFDIGVAQSGVARIRFCGKAGDTLTVRYSDLIYENGELNQDALSGFVKNYRFQTDMYTKATDEPETFQTTFAFHGFQYLEISGNNWEPELEDIEVLSLANDLPVRGSFSCGDETVNRIQQAAVNSTRSMLFSVMNSDTVREKLSWTGDTGLSGEQMLLNFGPEAFMTKWMRDLRDAQRPSGMLPCIVPTPGWGFTFSNGPDWSQPIYELPRLLYLYSGDTRELTANYDALCRYIGFLDTMAIDHIVNYGLGDWCAPFEGPALTVNMSTFKCPVAVSDTAYYYAAVRFAAQCALILGKTEDAALYAVKADEIRRAFRERFYCRETSSVAGDCQTATAMMISFGLAEPDEVPGLVRTLTDIIARDGGKLDYGILGMKAVLTALGENGHAQLALDMLTTPEYPSIGHWLSQGATTLWECWNGEASHNHHMFSSVSDFLYKYVAGIRCEAPCYRQITFEPMLGGTLCSAQASVHSLRGEVSIRWEKSGDGFTVEVHVPVGAQAGLLLPARYQNKDVAACLARAGVPAEACGSRIRVPLSSGSFILNV